MMFLRLLVSLAMLLVSSSLALAGQKYQATLVAVAPTPPATPPPLVGPLSPAFVNGTSKGSVKILTSPSTCKALIKLSGTTLADSDGAPNTGDEVICIVDINSDPAAPIPASLVLRGETKGGVTKIKEDLMLGSPACPVGPPVTGFRVTCYEPSPYAPAIIFPLTTPGTGLVSPGYAPRPPGGLIVTEGILPGM